MQPSSSVESFRSERNERPKWKFNSYHLEQGPEGRFAVKDETSVLDSSTDEYRANVVTTAISLTENLQQRLAAGEISPDEVAERCNAIRQELDREGVKVYFDSKKVEGDWKILPKWKYHINGSWKTERITDVPPAIMQLVREDEIDQSRDRNAKTARAYYRTPEYRNWFGPRMQNKREQVISDVLAESYPDVSEANPANSGAETLQKQGEQSMESRDEAKRKMLVEVAVSAMATKFEGKFKLPAQMQQFVDTVLTAAPVLFSVGLHANLHPIEEQRVVREGLLRHFNGKTAMLEALETALPEPPPTPAEAVDDDSEYEEVDLEPDSEPAPATAPVSSESAEAEAPSAPESAAETIDEGPATAVVEEEATEAEADDVEGNEEVELTLTAEQRRDIAEQQEVTDRLTSHVDRLTFERDRHYAGLREQLDALTSVKELDDFVNRQPNVGGRIDARSEAINQLLTEIHSGTAGRLSEERLTRLQRSSAEKTLFEAVPELNARNVRIDEAGETVAYLEKANPEEAAWRVLNRIAMSAFRDSALEGDAETADFIAGKLRDVLFRIEPNESLRQQISARLVSVSEKADKMVIKDLAGLKVVMKALATPHKAEPKE